VPRLTRRDEEMRSGKTLAIRDPFIRQQMIDLVRTDITTLDVDVIVNAANSALAGGGGVDGAIHRAAGPELVRASTALAPCPPGDAVLTPGFRLSARYVIHAVGPIWRGGERDESALLRSAYDRSFALAVAQGDVRSIAFPAISTGVYGFPKALAARIAVEAMRRHEALFERIVACVFDVEAEAHYREAMGSID
jgi:O-acetyl-ADP-ribose deacetylase